MGGLRNQIKRCVVTLASTDTGDVPITQVQYLDDVTDIEYLYSYGAHGVPPNGSLGVMFNSFGYAESNTGIFYNVELRPKGLEPGEYASGNFQEESFTTYLNDGSITIKSKTGSTITMDASGNIELSGNSTVTGNLTITGNLIVNGVSITSNGVEVGSLHTHGGSATAPTGAVSPTGVPN